MVDDRLTVEIADAKHHLRLQIDNRDHAVVWGQQSFFATFRCHEFPLVFGFIRFCFSALSRSKAIVVPTYEILRIAPQILENSQHISCETQHCSRWTTASGL